MRSSKRLASSPKSIGVSFIGRAISGSLIINGKDIIKF